MTVEQVREIKANGGSVKVKCEVWDRIVGYYAPKSRYNPAMKLMNDDRQRFTGFLES